MLFSHYVKVSIPLSHDYTNWLADLAPNLEILVFGDEASKDERTSNRCRGWPHKRMHCIQGKCFVHGRRFSILPILTLDRITANDIIEGSVTSESFVDFLQELVVCDNLVSLYSCC